jgi:hypothetical protein
VPFYVMGGQNYEEKKTGSRLRRVWRKTA